MNVLVINGSPRGEKSNSQMMCNSFLQGMSEGNNKLNIETLILKDKKFSDCRGCFGCWSKEDTTCVIKDDMQEMFKSFVEADLIFWVTPLYHFTITSLLKKFIERTLPINSPLHTRVGDSFKHPSHYDNLEEQKHILVSACGFPEHDNFNFMKDYMSDIAKGNLVETLFCGMTELFRVKELEHGLTWYFEALVCAGKEFVSAGFINVETKEILKKHLVSEELFIQMTNMHWKDSGNMDHLKYEITTSANKKETSTGNKKGKGYHFLENMKKSFNRDNGINIKGNVEFCFEDIDESGYFFIDNDEVNLHSGSSDTFVLKIITTYENWMKVSSGEIDGSSALMQGLYRIEGDMSLLMKMNKLFTSKDSAKPETESNPTKKFYGIKGSSWMTISFIPWILSWVFIENSISFGTTIPLIVSILILILKKRKNAVTFFEQMNGLYFLGLSLCSLFFSSEVLKYGVSINYFSMAIIWGISIFGRSSLTADYSIFNQEEDLSNNIIFHKTNEIITLFWTVLYISQGILKFGLESNGFGKYSILLYLLLIIGFRFTSVFSKWYPEYIMKRVR